jgi:hypothetical protein
MNRPIFAISGSVNRIRTVLLASSLQWVALHQSAYRILNDAEEYAIEHNMFEALVEVRETGANTATIEGNFVFAEKAYRRVKRDRKALGLKIPMGMHSLRLTLS